ncbi:MAG: ATP-dependent DNA helicase [Terriglobales bacterium]
MNVSSPRSAGTRPRTAAPHGLPSLYTFFGPGGVLSKTHPAYEFRRGQLDMAQAVEQALSEKRHLVVEAGTGTGKTLAYLVPVIRAGKRVVISTGTKTLQEQLFHKDVPFLEREAGVGKLRVCYMKGRNNYLCRQKLYDVAEKPVLTGLEQIDHFRIIQEWEKTTANGDRAELASLPEASALWPRLDARADACTGQKCRQYDRCFITEMRRRAAQSDIIIVNHHLFFADMAIRRLAERAPDAGILPEFGAVIFDEAHDLEDVASSYFGVTVSDLRIADLARDTETILKLKGIFTSDVQRASAGLRERAQIFFSVLPPGEGRFPFDARSEFLEESGDQYDELKAALQRLVSALQSLPQKPEEVFNLARRADELRANLEFLLESTERNTVFWIERRGRGDERRGRGGERGGGQHVFLQATPIEVAPILRQGLWEGLETAVLTSATLAVTGGFSYIRRRLGLDHARELVVPSHFDYARQALLYVPPDLPDPRTPQFAGRAGELIRQMLEITEGRAFCLFTSYAQMNEIHRRLADQLDFPVLLQGTAPKNALLEEFRATPNAVLFATSSFWQGVDVQGEQLSCVIIDRLPFAVPGDPVVAARIHCINEEGGNAFYDYQVPAAVISLKQGFGRLIRSLNDRGLLVLLDNRIQRQRYGQVFLESLPNYRRTTSLADVQEFFRKG